MFSSYQWPAVPLSAELLSATKIWNTHFKCQCFTKHGKPMGYQHHCSTFSCIWQHMGRNHSETKNQHLTTIPSIPVHKVYQHLLNNSLHLTPFNMQPSEDTTTLWDLFTHPGIYISALGSLIPVGIGLFCCYFFWCWPARSACQPLKSGNTQYTIVDYNVEDAPIYRCEGKAPKSTRPCEESWPGYRSSTYTVGESSEATVEVICSPCPRIIGKILQNPGDAGMHITSVTRLRLDTSYNSTDWNNQNRRKQNNSWLTDPTFDVDDTDCHMLPVLRSDISSKHL